MKRHPKACFYWMKFGNCKLGSHCAYKHGKSKEFEKIEKIETKMNEVLEKSKAKDELRELYKVRKKKNVWKFPYLGLTP